MLYQSSRIASTPAAITHLWTCSFLALSRGDLVSVSHQARRLVSIHNPRALSISTSFWEVSILVNFFEHSSLLLSQGGDVNLLHAVPSALWMRRFPVLCQPITSLIHLVSINVTSASDAMEEDACNDDADGREELSGDSVRWSMDAYINHCLRALLKASQQSATTDASEDENMTQLSKLLHFLSQADILTFCMDRCIDGIEHHMLLRWYAYVLLLTARDPR